jgi:NADPH:quinone reductase-like Zn-dependent oxidoreductase
MIDYSGDVPAAIGERHPDGIDGVIDLATRDPDAFDRLARHVRAGGRVASSIGVADVGGLAKREVKATNLNAQADTSGFEKVLAAAGEGRLRIPVERVFSLEDVPQGLELLASGTARGKFVVRVGSES